MYNILYNLGYVLAHACLLMHPFWHYHNEHE